MMMPITTERADSRSDRSAKSRDLIRAVLRRYMLHPDDFFGLSREAHLVAARHEAARDLRAAGYALSAIARLLRRNHSTILHYLNGGSRKEAMRQRARVTTILLALPLEVRAVVEAYAAANEVTPTRAVLDWIIERATYEAQAKARAA